MNSNLFTFKAGNFAQLHHHKHFTIYFDNLETFCFKKKKKSVNLYTRDICGNGYIVVYHLGEFLMMLDIDSSKHTKNTKTNRKPSLVQSRIRTVLPRKWLFTDILLGATKAYCLYDLLYIQKFSFLRETMVTTVGPDKTMKSHTPF